MCLYMPPQEDTFLGNLLDIFINTNPGKLMNLKKPSQACLFDRRYIMLIITFGVLKHTCINIQGYQIRICSQRTIFACQNGTKI